MPTPRLSIKRLEVLRDATRTGYKSDLIPLVHLTRPSSETLTSKPQRIKFFSNSMCNMNGYMFLAVLFSVACLLEVGNGHRLSCCNRFTTIQKTFLRRLLKEEAKGLSAGMMNALSTPKVQWLNISTKPVCFGARNNQFGAFSIKSEGFIAAIKLVHVSGSVTCDKNSCAKTPVQYNSKWGCATTHPYVGNTPLNTVVTTSNNKIVFPKDHSNLWYNLEQFDSNSDLLVFKRFDDPLYVAAGQELRLWFGEDLKDVSESDNDGRTCAHVFGYYL